MGLDFSEPEAEADTEHQPAWGNSQLSDLRRAITSAAAVSDYSVREVLLDAINHRYRHPAYRKLIILMEASKHISQGQRRDMHRELNRIRHVSRTPRSKAWRYQWP